MRILLSLARMGWPAGPKELADALSLAPPKVHRYLVNLVRAGAVEQVGAGRYRLGQAATEIGLSAIGSMKGMRLATEALFQLREALNETVCMAVWAQQGPTVLLWEQANRSVVVNVRAGSVLPMLTSASGMILAAFDTRGEVQNAVKREARALRRPMDAVREDLDAVRRDGFIAGAGILLPQVSAVCASVFDHRGQATYALSALGYVDAFDLTPEGRIVGGVTQAARALSARLDRQGNAPAIGA